MEDHIVIFTSDRSELAEAISRASAGIPARPLQPVYAGMLLRARGSTVELVASDGHVSFIATAPADVTQEGAALIPGKMLTEISRYFAGEKVRVSCGAVTEITAGRSEFTLSCGDPQDYPMWEQPAFPPMGTIEGFSSAVRKVSTCASRTDMVLRAMCLTPSEGRLFMTCTDRASMAVMSLPWDGEGLPALVAAEVMEQFARVAGEGPVHLGWNSRLVTIASPGLQVISPMIQGKFLDWEKVYARVPDRWAAVSTPDLTRAVKAAALQGDWAEFAFGEDLRISSASAEGSFSDHVETGDYQGQAVFTVSARKVLDGLSGCSDVLRAGFAGALFLRSAGYDFMLQPRR